MNPPIHRTRLLAASLALALCWPSNSYALRPLNAGMEESPVRRELNKILNHSSEGFFWAATASILLGVATLLYAGYTYVGAKISGSDIDPLGIEARKKIVVPPHRELPQQTIAPPKQVPSEPDSTPLPWTSEEEFRQWYGQLVLFELSSQETMDSILQYFDDLQQGSLSLGRLIEDYYSWKNNPDPSSLKPYQQQAVKNPQPFLGWLSSLKHETGGDPIKMGELLKQRIPELEKQQKRASELLERHLAEDSGFFSWFLDLSDAAGTRRDLAFYAQEIARELVEEWNQFSLREKLMLWIRRDELGPRAGDPGSPDYAEQRASSELRRDRFSEVLGELLKDLEMEISSSSNIPENGARRLVRVLQSPFFVPAEQRIAPMDPQKQLEAVLGRLPVLFELVEDRRASTERARERLDSILASIGQQRLAEPLGQLIRWAAKEKMDSGTIDAALMELGVLLNQRDFHLLPSVINRPDPLWGSWLFKIVLRGTVGGKELLFVQRLRGNHLLTLSGYHPLDNKREKDIGVVLMDETFEAARDLRRAAASGSVRDLFFLGPKDSDKQLERQLGQMLRRFADQGILPLDDLELWKQRMFSTAVHEYTHAVGYGDEYEARLAEMAVGNPAATIAYLYPYRNDTDEESRLYAYEAAKNILGALEYWRSSPLDTDGSALRRLSGTLLNQTNPRLFNHFNSPAIQRDLKILMEQISTLQPKESLQDRLMGKKLSGRSQPHSGLEETLDRIAGVVTGKGASRFMLGIGPGRFRQSGLSLIRFLDGLKDRIPELNPFVLLMGNGAADYAENPSVLLATSSVSQTVEALSLLGDGTLAYWGGLEETTALTQQLQLRNVPISVNRIESDQLEDVLSFILGNLAGLEENFSSLEVEALYGIHLPELAAQMKQLAQIGV